ncbi:MAG: response regulator, partial [Acidobacteriaceae bacterium]|nr:response regulator [Acidobacteriaceae bacterium]
ILLDVCMPDVNGFTLCEQIRERFGTSEITIMMLSSVAYTEHVARCRELGVSIYLTKPVGQIELRRSVVAALSGAAKQSHSGRRTTSGAASTQPERPLRILLAEDNLVNQKLACTLLARHGHSVTIANNGLEALSVLSSEEFDVVLMDLQMPEMGGFEATATIRAREKFTGSHVPVIALTAHAMKGDREKCLNAGMDGYVSKPIKVDELLQAIFAALQPSVSNELTAPAL